MSKKYHFIYKTTNLINGKHYYGKRSTNNLEDGYLGSGLLITRAISKYGRDNFKREILEFCDNSKDLNEREKYWISHCDVDDQMCYNLKTGGDGGDTRYGKSDEEISDIVAKLRQTRIDNETEFSQSTLLNMSKSAKIRSIELPHTIPNNKGRKHSQEFKNKVSKRFKGTIRINNGETTQVIPSDSEIPEGWSRGRHDSSFKNKTHTKDSKSLIASKFKGKIRITDGNSNLWHDSSLEIPHGWRRGFVKKSVNYMFINDGVSNKQHDKSKPIPDGWEKGRLLCWRVPESTIWITNGTENRRVSPDSEIPDNWYRGLTR